MKSMSTGHPIYEVKQAYTWLMQVRMCSTMHNKTVRLTTNNVAKCIP